MRRYQLVYIHVYVSHVDWRTPHEIRGALFLLGARLLPGGRTGTAAWRALALPRRRPARHPAVRSAGNSHGTASGVNLRLSPPPAAADMGWGPQSMCR
jgi:hypothetical protein